ncbi:CHAD domain-containing protein [Amycolatopsis lexingtonensis]|uniref:CHAD domain-containing protein n=1 Tax=Amycolatopsis lexingtonensis TaxID=218822 RepID=UPI000A375F73
MRSACALPAPGTERALSGDRRAAHTIGRADQIVHAGGRGTDRSRPRPRGRQRPTRAETQPASTSARYAAEAVAPVIGREATRLAGAIAEVQEGLGEHHDAVIAAQQWAELAGRHPDDPAVTPTCGRLIERERAAARANQAQFGHLWSRATRSEFTHRLRSQRS